MSSRSSSLFRWLLAASLPLAAVAGAAPVLLTALSGCSCGDGTTVVPISQTDYDRLLKKYGSDGLPVGDCQAICVIVTAADAGEPVSIDSRIHITGCSLTTIEWNTPAAICTGSSLCEG
jgi:hypothetical protein